MGRKPGRRLGDAGQGLLAAAAPVCLSVSVNVGHVELTLASLSLLASLIFVPALLFVSLCLQGSF